MDENGVNPESPGVSPVQLNGCIEELVKFVLQSSVNGTLGMDVGLSTDFCAGLLKDDSHNARSHHQIPSYTDMSEGVPPYPLYKRLAFSLQQCIISGSLSSICDNDPPFSVDDPLKQMKEKWNEIVSQKGSELVKMLKSIKFELHVQEPFFSQLKDGLKTIEGRCAVGNYNRIQPRDLIFFNKCLMLDVQDVRHHASFLEMLEAESLDKVLPGVPTIEEGEQIYRKFYTQEKERLNGVLAICVGRPACQPYSLLSDIISGLGYRGIQSLLGLKQTVGTIPESLPPPRSTLLSSFVLLYKPNVKGCALTDGARALTKHVNRCSSNYWGELEGNVHRVSGAIHGGRSSEEMEALSSLKINAPCLSVIRDGNSCHSSCPVFSPYVLKILPLTEYLMFGFVET